MLNEDYLFDVEIESNYGYNSLDSIVDVLYNNVVNFQTFFQNGNLFEEDLELIRVELENTAKRFAIEQGLGPGGAGSSGTSLVHYGTSHKDITTVSSPITGPTGNLYYHIKAERDNEKITLKNDAKNSRGQYYAGHIEFGFRNRGGGMVPARPFLRPALYAVADASKGQLSGSLKRYLEQIWALETLQFGALNISRGRAREFYKLAHNPQAKGYGMKTASNLPKSRLKQMRTKEAREKQTVYRKTEDKAKRDFSRKVGSRMGYKAGKKDARGNEHLSTTTWYRGKSSGKNKSTSSKRTSSKKESNKKDKVKVKKGDSFKGFSKKEKSASQSFVGGFSYNLWRD